MVKEEIYVAHWEQTKWLVLSSFSFMIPSLYAFAYNLYNHAFLLFIASIVSINYWRKATYSWRRNIDIVCARVAFSIFFYNGVLYVKSLSYLITGYAGLFLLCYCYYLSGKYLAAKHSDWYKYHALFHIIMTYEQMIIINSILGLK